MANSSGALWLRLASSQCRGADCALQAYCGADPVHNYGTQGDLVGHRPTSDFHKKNFAIIKHLLELYHSGSTVRAIFEGWVQNIPAAQFISEVSGEALLSR